MSEMHLVKILLENNNVNPFIPTTMVSSFETICPKKIHIMNDENENIMSFRIDNIFNKKQSNTLLVSAKVFKEINKI